MTLLHALVLFVRRLITRLFGRTGPTDPYASVRAPRHRGPRDRHGSVALAEPVEPVEPGETVVAVGRRR
jgi:hypothetical protein